MYVDGVGNKIYTWNKIDVMIMREMVLFARIKFISLLEQVYTSIKMQNGLEEHLDCCL